MIIFETLFLLIEMDLLMKIKVANGALYNFSKLQTFLLHDVKNVTQFIKGASLQYRKDRRGGPGAQVRRVPAGLRRPFRENGQDTCHAGDGLGKGN